MNIFLDDQRNPADVDLYLNTTPKFADIDWTIVRNYDAFVSLIEEHGLPNIIAFDHDLAEEAYVPEEYWDNYEASKQFQEQQYTSYKEKTGLHCARWVIDYCKKYNQPLPDYIVHSQNPVGKDWIEAELKNFKNGTI